MDNQNLNLPTISRFSPMKIVFILLGLVIVGEVIWAISQLTTVGLPTQTNNATVPKNVVTPVSIAQVTLSSDKTSVKVGDKITVAINVSANKETDGTDLIINFDPTLLNVDTQNEKKVPVVTGQIYPDYPVNSLDSAKGKITVSGIASAPGGVVTNGVFGTLNLMAKAPGTAKLTLEFTKGSTTDTNVIEAGVGTDILNSVSDLTINITP
ncbi:MAG: hypothetical protein HYW45_03515 [Candidatus Daviesbacteria bacterium]|nr:MAG: hypothetical protein HYW45_03515 [Candidatus Daviesbacteria bacterium]